MEEKIFKYIFAALLAGIIICAAGIAWLLLRPEPKTEIFSDAVLVWEGFRHAAI